MSFSFLRAPSTLPFAERRFLASHPLRPRFNFLLSVSKNLFENFRITHTRTCWLFLFRHVSILPLEEQVELLRLQILFDVLHVDILQRFVHRARGRRSMLRRARLVDPIVVLVIHALLQVSGEGHWFRGSKIG